MTRTEHASIHDRRFAGAHPAVVLGPVRIPGGPNGIRERLREFARAGRHTRLGLAPRRDSARWSVDAGEISVVERAIGNPLDVGAELTRIGRVRTPALCIEVVGGDHLVVAYDHGLGDGVFIVELLAALTRSAAQFPLAAGGSQTTMVREPVRAALTHQLREHPAEVARGTARVLLRRNTTKALAPRATVTPDGSTRAVYASSSPDFLDHIREYRDARHAGASVITVLTHLVAEHLRDNRFTVSDSATFMVNLRRYLPDDRSTLGNFIGAVDADTRSPAETTDRLRAVIRRPDLLIRQSISDGVARVFPNRLAAAHDFRRVHDDSIRLVVSDLTAHPAADTIDWDTGHPRTYAIAGVTRASNQVSLVLTRIDRELHVTAALPDEYVDAGAVHSALTSVLNAPLAVP